MQIPLVIYTLALGYSKELEETIICVEEIKSLGYQFEHIVILGKKLSQSSAEICSKYSCKFEEVPPTGIYSSLKSVVYRCDPTYYVWVINPGDKPDRQSFSTLATHIVEGFDGIKGVTDCYLSGEYQYSFPKNRDQLQSKYHFHHQSLILRAEFYQNIDFEKYRISGDKYIYLKFEERHTKLLRTCTTLATMNLGGVSQNGSQEFTKFIEDTKIDFATNNVVPRRFIMRIAKSVMKYLVFNLFGPNASTNMMKFFMRNI